jgi:hypothetical protein
MRYFGFGSLTFWWYGVVVLHPSRDGFQKCRCCSGHQRRNAYAFLRNERWNWSNHSTLNKQNQVSLKTLLTAVFFERRLVLVYSYLPYRFEPQIAWWLAGVETILYDCWIIVLGSLLLLLLLWLLLLDHRFAVQREHRNTFLLVRFVRIAWVLLASAEHQPRGMFGQLPALMIFLGDCVSG